MPKTHFQQVYTLIFIFCFYFLSHVHGGAWPLRPGHGNATVGFSFLKGGMVSDGQGQKRDYAIQETGLSTFGEVGLLPNLAVTWSWGIIKGVKSDSSDNMGLTDPELAFTYHLGHRGPWYFAAMLNSRFPIGPANAASVPEYVYPFFSQQVWAWDARPILGWSQPGWWLQGSLGPRLRTGGLAPQFGYNLASGKKLGARFSSMLAFSGILPLDNKSEGNPADREKYLGFQLAFVYQPYKQWNTGVQFDGMFGPFQGMPLALRTNIFGKYSW